MKFTEQNGVDRSLQNLIILSGVPGMKERQQTRKQVKKSD